MFLDEATALERFASCPDPYALFDDLVRTGTPLVHPTGPEMTFLVNTQQLGSALPAEPVTEVHLWINRLTDKLHHEHGVMLPVPGTTLWVRTVEVPPTLRAAYCYRLNAGGHRPPGHNSYPHARDPHARFGTVVANGDCGLSLLLGTHQRNPSFWEGLDFQAPRRYQQFAKGGQQYFLYTPAAPFAGLPLVELIDADMWFYRQRLDLVLDRLIAAGGLPPVAVVGRGFASAQDRKTQLGLNPEFLEELHTQLPQIAARRAGESGHTLSALPPIIAGQSLGAFNALYAAVEWPTAFSAVIAHSPSMWWSPRPDASPRDLLTQITPWLVSQLYLRPDSSYSQLPPAFIEAGLREDQLLPHCLNLIQALQDCGWEHHYRTVDGGHDVAWWREGLISRLSQALERFPTARVKTPPIM